MSAIVTGIDAIPALFLLAGSALCFLLAWKRGSL